MKKLAILSTHPIQYNAPLFRMFDEDDQIQLHVFFSKTWAQTKYDPDFQREVIWDLPVSQGYSHSSYDAASQAGKKELTKAIQSFEPDALIVYGWNFPGHFKVMRKFYGTVPIGFRGDSHLLNPISRPKRIIKLLILHRIYRYINIAYSVGTANSAYFLASGVNIKKICLAPHAVEAPYWERDEETRCLLAKQWKISLGIPEDAICIGFAGKLEKIKQVGLILDVLAKIANPNLYFLIAGTGPLEKQLKLQSANNKNVHFLGFVNQSQMPIFYRMLNRFILPSSSETWGLSVNESIHCGTPCIVSSRVGCAIDIANHNPDLCNIVEWNDSKAWAHALSHLSPNRIDQTTTRDFATAFNYTKLISSIKTTILIS